MRGDIRSRIAAVVLAAASAALAGCAPALATRRGPSPIPDSRDGVAARRATAPYGTTLRILIRAGGREASFRAGCAVDPRRGVRIEVRDPLGATRLLVLLDDAGGTLAVDPARGLESRWGGASEPLPWVPDALRAFLAGLPPAGAGPSREKGGTVRFEWPSASGTVKAALVASSVGPAPYAEGEFKGPGRARLHLAVSGTEPGELKPEAFRRPSGDLRTTDIWDLLSGGAP